MKIVCVDVDGCKGITKDKTYETDGLECETYSIINDFGHRENYFEFHFKVIEK